MTKTAAPSHLVPVRLHCGTVAPSYRHGTILYDDCTPAVQFLLGRTRLHAMASKTGSFPMGQDYLGIAACYFDAKALGQLGLFDLTRDANTPLPDDIRSL